LQRAEARRENAVLHRRYVLVLEEDDPVFQQRGANLRDNVVVKRP
jgi:hypothetical protein